MSFFRQRVVALALSIPPGKVTTYGRIARAAGGGNMASQSITRILSQAWEQGEKNIPWHRIVYADGRVWLDATHASERLTLYRKEGLTLDQKNRIQNFRDHLYEFH